MTERRPQPGPQERFLSTSADICIYGGSAGGGKCQSVHEPVLTPFGFRPMGELKVGSIVTSSHGTPAEVIGVFPQGQKKLYKITFVDGASTRCTEEHLWLAKEASKQSKLRHRNGWKIYTTAQLAERVSKGKNMLIPLTEPVRFTIPKRSTVIKPYTFGVILGDGSLTSSQVAITKNDQELFDNVVADGYEVRERSRKDDSKARTFSVINFSNEREWLRKHNLNVTSDKKYIPEAYKYASVEDRYALIQGLMDTDGYADGRGHCEYCTTSKQLAEDVQWIIWSLGGKATISEKDPTYTLPDGTRKDGKRAYIVYIQTKDNSKLFRLTRKKERCDGISFNGGFSELKRRIVSIEPCGFEECQCIQIDEPDGLYVTKDFVVTHNTYALLLGALRYKDVPGFNCTIFRKNFTQIFIQGGLWDESLSVYSGIKGARRRKGDASWIFTDKDGRQLSKVSFAHVERKEELDKWQGSQICALCCEVGTPVLMADGTYKDVADIAVGDIVKTLNGDHPVTAVGNEEWRECVEIKMDDGMTQRHTTDHKLLTKNGWISYEDISTNTIEEVAVFTQDGDAQSVQYRHPYTGEIETATECIRYCTVSVEPCGKRVVRNITVDCKNHYITGCGVVNKNCFDEITHFQRETFFYMLSRNRSTCGIKPYVRATCNPDANSWVADFISWWINQDTGYPIPERSGVKRWFIRRGEDIFWADTKKELIKQFNLKTPEEREEPKSVTFIASSIYDNQELLKTNPQYLANLKALATVERERLLYGNWKIKPSSGMYFKRSQVEVLKALPNDVQFYCRAWDLAATEDTGSNDPDYTAGVLMGRRKDGSFVIIDVIRERIKAGDVQRLILNTAKADRAKHGARYTVRIPQDPGAAGKIVASTYTKLLAGFSVKVEHVTGSKETRATPLAAQWQNGNVFVMESQWLETYFTELENFPEGQHDDMVDASSDAFNELAQARFNLSSLL